MNPVVDVAYYYPAPFWHGSQSGWIKSLLLFFDQIAILLPDYMYGRHIASDPTMVLPLEERGLLRVLEPKQWVDQETTEQLATVLVELLTVGAFDDLPEAPHFAELSQSRIGYGADVELGDMLVEELCAKGLARPSEDGVSVPLHPVVRTTILVTLAQLARGSGVRHGMTFHPTTNYPEAIRDLIGTLSRHRLPSAGHVVTLDLEAVTLNLEDVSLDDVLEFRESHSSQHKAYLRDLLRFTSQIALTDDAAERERLLLDRRDELAEAAHNLRRLARQAFRRKLATWSLGLAGAVWGLSQHDPLGLALGAASQLLDVLPTKKHVTAYSYLFFAGERLSKA